MFEIYKRHNPVFVLSEIKCLAKTFTNILQLNDFNLSTSMELVDISQTVRINENNQFIIRSNLSPKNVTNVLDEAPVLKQLRKRSQENVSTLIVDLLKAMMSSFGIDSYILLGECMEEVAYICTRTNIPQATKDSKKPLVIFNELKKLEYRRSNTVWEGMDHPALWLGETCPSAMDEVEAFFAMSPELKLEIGLNRYQMLENFGRFSVGFVRF